jgi:hypothetical protein
MTGQQLIADSTECIQGIGDNLGWLKSPYIIGSSSVSSVQFKYFNIKLVGRGDICLGLGITKL